MPLMYWIWLKYSKSSTNFIKNISILKYKITLKYLNPNWGRHLLLNLVISPSGNEKLVTNQSITSSILNYKNLLLLYIQTENQFTLQKYNFSQIFSQGIYLKSTKSNLINMISYYKMISIQREILSGSFLMSEMYKKTL